MPLLRLSGPQLLRLRDALRDAFVPTAFVELLLLINRRLEDHSRAVDAYPEQVLSVLLRADSAGWLHELLDAALASRSSNPVLQELSQQLRRTGAAALEDPYRICCLSGDHIMVNRNPLREALRAMNQPLGKRILVVRDLEPVSDPALQGTRTGKSLSLQLVSALQQGGHLELVWLDLWLFKDRLGIGTELSAQDLGMSLVRKLGYGDTQFPLPRPDAQSSRWAIEFCDVFEERARRDPRPLVWLVIDEFNKVRLPAETLNLVKQLAERVQVTLTRFRLMLIGYTDGFAPALLPLIQEDRLQRGLSARDLIEFLDEAARQQQIELDEDTIVDAVTTMLSGLDVGQHDYLEELGRRALSGLRRLTGAAGGGG